LLFETYRFDRPDTDQALVLDGWSWICAAIAGPVYVLLLGYFKPALQTLLVSLVLTSVTVISLVFIVGFIDSMLLSIVAVVVIPAAALLVQATVAIQAIRHHLLLHGWRAGH
jgi:hypothetical protein